MTIQNNIIFHIAFSQGILFTLFGVIGLKNLAREYQSNHVSKWHMIVIFLLTIIAVLAQSYAIAGLSLTFFIFFSLIKSFVYLAHDIWQKELQLDRQNIGAFLLILTGILAINTL